MLFFFVFFFFLFSFSFLFFFCCCFSGEHVNDFHHSFSVFSLLIVFFHVTNFLCTDCFFAAFFSSTSFLCCCSASPKGLRELFLPSSVFYPTLLPHICHNTANATDLREIFLPSGVFYLRLLPDMLHNGMLDQPAIKASLGYGSFSLKLQSLPTVF